jgi:histidine triad (HIT) family protein
MTDCIFCKIAAHEVPSTIVYEDDAVVAFKDLDPQAPVHVLVIPRDHYADIADVVPGDVLAAMAHAVSCVAHDTGIDKTGFRVISNTGDDAGQTVHHLHWHVLGGKGLGAGLLPADAE